jgi:hypothetical protein
MFESIGNFWTEHAIGDKLYLFYAVIVLFIMTISVWQYVCHRPKRKLDFIAKAQKENCTAVGKMTCLTLHGIGYPQYYKAEYMYVVDDKRYFVTYQMSTTLNVDNRTSCMNADMLLLKLKPAILFFYDKNKPKKALSKLEVFTSEDRIRQVGTLKKNIYRNTEKDWDGPIDLVSY